MPYKEFWFRTHEDATAVKAQLYGGTLQDNVLSFDWGERPDQRAIDLAAGLVGIEFMVVGAACRLPFPSQERECTDPGVPKIWVGCMAAYNCGHLHGMWIDATQDAEDIQADIDWMLSWSPVGEQEVCEEWCIYDFEDFGACKIGEHEDLERVSKIASLIEEHGTPFALYAANDGVLDEFENYYIGKYKNLEDFAYSRWEENGRIAALEAAGIHEDYIDWAYVGRELKIGGDYDIFDVGYEELYAFHPFTE